MLISHKRQVLARAARTLSDVKFWKQRCPGNGRREVGGISRFGPYTEVPSEKPKNGLETAYYPRRVMRRPTKALIILISVREFSMLNEVPMRSPILAGPQLDVLPTRYTWAASQTTAPARTLRALDA